MHLHRLRLRNYCQHKKLDVEFRPGLNGILGGNGHGKSNLLDALRFAVTGESVNHGNKKDNLTWGADKGYVEVELTSGDTAYTIRRAVESPKATLTFAGTTLNKSSEIDDFLIRLFGCPMRALLDNVFIPQGRIDSILSAKPSDRLKEFQQTFGLDRAADAHKWLGQEANLYTVSAGLNEQLNGCVEAVLQGRKDLEQLNLETSAKRRLIEELEVHDVLLRQAIEATRTAEAIRQADARVGELNGQLQTSTQEVEAADQSYQTLAQQTEQLKSVATATDVELRGLEQDLTLYQRSADLRPRLIAAQQACAALANVDPLDLASKRQQLEAILAEFNRYEGMIKLPLSRPLFPEEVDLVAQRDAIQQELYVIPPSLQPQQDEVALVFQIEQVGKHIELAKAGKCPTCAAPFAHDPVALEAERAQLRTTLQALQSERRSAYSALRQGVTDRLNKVVTRLAELQVTAKNAILAMRDDVARSYHETKAEVDRLEAAEKAKAAAVQQVALLEAQLNGAPTVAPDQGRIDTLRTLVEQFRDHERQLQVRHNALQLAQSRYDMTRGNLQVAIKARETLGEGLSMPSVDQIETAKVKVGELQLARTALSELQHHTAVQTVALEEREKNANRLREQLGREARDAAWVEQVRKVRDALHVGALPALMMREYGRALNLRMEHYLTMWESPFRLHLDDDMAFRATFEGGACEANRLSGGQKIVASASFRLAMSDTFARQVGLLVFDEPSTFLDRENIQHLQMLLLKLKDMSRHTGRQILIVTHEESLMNFLDHVIEIP